MRLNNLYIYGAKYKNQKITNIALPFELHFATDH